MLTLGSLFDGIGGFPLAAAHNGITPIWASEIEAFPIEVTKTRFPDMVHAGDITKLNGAELPPVDVITGGSPCQDLSVAGARAGLAGERSGLFMDQIRITKEMRLADEQRGVPDHLVRPRFLVWENVPGAFSSAGGEDFRAVLEEIVRVKDGTAHVPRSDSGTWQSAGAIILGDEFSLAWRVLDAQYWGVAQRRRRIFLVADFAGACAPQILFKQDSLRGDTASCGSTRQGAAAAAKTGAGNSNGLIPPDTQQIEVKAYHINLRNEGIDLGGVSGALMATSNMQMQTFVTHSPKDDEQCEAECLTPWDVQSRRVYEESGIWPALYGGDGGGHGYVRAEEKTAVAFAANQRDEVRNLNDVAGALGAQPGMKQQTFVAEMNCLNSWDAQQSRVFMPEGTAPTLAGADGGGGRNPGGLLLAAGFCAGASPAAGSIGYCEEVSPTLKSAESGTNMVPSVLCLNDQGGERMDMSENISGTLRAGEKGHPPLVMATQQGGAEIGVGVCPTITSAAGTSGNNQPVLFENHGIDSRYTGPHEVAPTMSARYGTGGNNLPLISQPEETYCIAGNIIDREVQNGGNGFGYQADISYTLTGADRHAVFARQRSDEFCENDVVATQSARQHKDATNIICQPYQETIGALCRGDEKGIGNQYVSQNKCIVERRNLIRRLTPLECERLQGFPDGWTDIPGASDSVRYKALGNSVAIPCVDFVLRGIAYFLRQAEEAEKHG